jgi:20S proteasome alpha/beta subunit
MTYILGCRCSEGVVLVADKKIINIEGGAESKYSNKLFSDLESLIIGYSGARRVFELFRNEIIDYVTAYRDAYHVHPTIAKLNTQITEISYKLNNRYRHESFDLIAGAPSQKNVDRRSHLDYFYPDGTMEPIDDYRAIGTGAPFGSIYLKQNWSEHMTMKQVAELGYFIIKYIERFHLDLAVGVNDSKPQIWFVPDNGVDYCANLEVLNELDENTEMSLKRVEENKLFNLF